MGPDITVSYPAAALFADAPPRFGQQDSRSFQPDRKTEEEALEEEDWLRQKVAEARQKRRKQVRATCDLYLPVHTPDLQSSGHPPLASDLGPLEPSTNFMVWVHAFASAVCCPTSYQCQA